MPTDPARTIGVCGAGTMGAGIAQLACQSGARTLLYDPVPEALASASERIGKALRRSAERGRLTDDQAQAALAALKTVGDLAALAPCDLVIEAAPEQLAVKHELLGALAEVVGEDCVLATNTSSLLVTAVAAGVPRPERVVGMHFFNPPPVMALVEVVAGTVSDDASVQRVYATAEAMDRTPILAADGIGFIANRCNRPFNLEALRLLTEQRAPLELIDRLCRMGGGFRMGPFELMDLVGVDTSLDVSRSFYEQSFGEPRWRPSPVAVRTVAAGHLGRKTGRGFYAYPEGAGHREPDPDPPAFGGGDGLIVIAGETMLAYELAAAAQDAGWDVAVPEEAEDDQPPFLILDLTGEDEPEAPLQGAPQAICCHAGSLAAIDPGGSAVGFHTLPPLHESTVVELTAGPGTSQASVRAAETFFASLGKHTALVGDGPGLVLGRIVCQLVNEAAFALGDGVGSAQDIDTAMVGGLNHPRGILGWADTIGIDHVLAVLDALSAETGDPRYRVAPVLRQLAWSGRQGLATGEGFFRYEQSNDPDF
jgi:3-hydroxybutyryl-CoA dehydrogenase